MSELKPCPFCGGEAHITLEQAMWFIECENEDCGAMMGFEAEVVSRIEAIAAWNRRAQPASEPLTPCDACRYNPPSSCDGKPCVMCPASGKPGGEQE